MFINPKIAIQEGWITLSDCQTLEDWTERNYVSPNAIDFTLDKLYTINADNIFSISEEGKQMRGGNVIEPTLDRRTNIDYWRLDPHTSYDGMSDIFVKVPEGVAAYLIIRSTFNRNGVFITSGLYDSGFEGNIGFAIHNNSGVACIGTGTRIGQIIFVESQNASMYAGGYNTQAGQHWSDSQT